MVAAMRRMSGQLRSIGLVDLSADQRSQVRQGGRRIERVEPFGWQVADARSEPVAENGMRQRRDR